VPVNRRERERESIAFISNWNGMKELNGCRQTDCIEVKAVSDVIRLFRFLAMFKA
jgi:hypothetical protein